MGRFDGKVVLITGGAPGQGRSHAPAFAREGADVAFCDITQQLATDMPPDTWQGDDMAGRWAGEVALVPGAARGQRIVWPASAEARYVTGGSLPVDARFLPK